LGQDAAKKRPISGFHVWQYHPGKVVSQTLAPESIHEYTWVPLLSLLGAGLGDVSDEGRVYMQQCIWALDSEATFVNDCQFSAEKERKRGIQSCAIQSGQCM